MSSLFLWEDYTWSTRRGVVLVCCVWATALVMAVSLRFIVERAKKCLDFVCTYHFFNLVATWLMSGLPLSYRWWVVQGVGLLIAVLLGEWICFLEETKEIKVNKPDISHVATRLKKWYVHTKSRHFFARSTMNLSDTAMTSAVAHTQHTRTTPRRVLHV